MKKEVKPVKRLVILSLSLILLLGLAINTTPSSAQASLKTDTWLKYPVPQKGLAGNWLLTSNVTIEGTGVTAIGIASGGTIYVATEESAGSPLNGYHLFKSTDGGTSFTALWKIPASDKPAGGPATDPASKVISLVLPRRDHPEILYLATQYYVYRSLDGGENFNTVASRPTYGSGATAANSRLITSLDVTYYNGNHLVLVGSRDADAAAGDYGGVYLYDESQPFSPWVDLLVGNGAAAAVYDVLDIAFSPNFSKDEQVVALVSDDVAATTKVTTRFSIAGWNSIIGDATLGAFSSSGGSLAFPSDYNADISQDKCIHYVGVDAGALSSIYMIIGNETPNASQALLMLLPTASNAVYTMDTIGELSSITIIAGLTSGNVFSYSVTSQLYSTASTPPSVTATAQNACVAIGELNLSGYTVYAGTSGTNGGLARSVDSGDTFAQIAFICDDLQTITDLAVSPNYDYDGTIYMITQGNSNKSILWRTTDYGKTWEAVLTQGQDIRHGTSLTTVAAFNKVKISPYFAFDTTIFIAESVNAPRIWRSTDNGFHFAPLPSKTGTAGTILSWIVAGAKIVLVGDSAGNFYKTDDAGTTWSDAVATGLANFSSMDLSPDYENDATIVAGDNAGRIYLSQDDGKHWQRLSPTPASLGAGTLVAFSPYYAVDKTVYAADRATNTGILRFTIGTSADWERIDQANPNRIEEATKAGKVNISGLRIVADGEDFCTLYATESDPVITRVIGVTAAEGGVAHSLNPTASLTPTTQAPLFEIVNTGLGAGVTLSGLWYTKGSDTILWSVDTNAAPDVLYSYIDTLTAPLEPTSPADGASSGRQASCKVSWQGKSSATSYNLWYDIDPSFRLAPVQIYSTGAGWNIAPAGGLTSGTTYHWRVRVGQQGNSIFTPGTAITYGAPALSRFSETWSFTTTLGAAQWSPFPTVGNFSPAPGAKDVDLIKPIFQWNPSDGAEGYEFQLSDNPSFAGADTKKIKQPTYQWPGVLDFGETYYWRVRAYKADTLSEWATAIFTTAEEPVPPPAPSPAPPLPTLKPMIPLPLWVIIGIGSLLLITVLILIMKIKP